MSSCGEWVGVGRNPAGRGGDGEGLLVAGRGWGRDCLPASLSNGDQIKGPHAQSGSIHRLLSLPLHVGIFNAHSIGNKSSSEQKVIVSSGSDVFCTVETWHDPATEI